MVDLQHSGEVRNLSAYHVAVLRRNRGLQTYFLLTWFGFDFLYHDVGLLSFSGNPIGIHETEYDTEFPMSLTHELGPVVRSHQNLSVLRNRQCFQPEDVEPWTPHPAVQPDATSSTYSYTLSVLSASSSLGL